MKFTQTRLLPILGLSLDVFASNKTMEEVAADFEMNATQGSVENSTCSEIYRQQDFYENLLNPDLHDYDALDGSHYIISYNDRREMATVACRNFKGRNKFYRNGNYVNRGKKIRIWEPESAAMQKVWKEWKKKTPGKMKRAKYECVNGTWVLKTFKRPANYPVFLPQCPLISSGQFELDENMVKGTKYGDFSLIIPAYVYPWDFGPGSGGPLNARWQAINESVIANPNIMHNIIIKPNYGDQQSFWIVDDEAFDAVIQYFRNFENARILGWVSAHNGNFPPTLTPPKTMANGEVKETLLEQILYYSQIYLQNWRTDGVYLDAVANDDRSKGWRSAYKRISKLVRSGAHNYDDDGVKRRPGKNGRRPIMVFNTAFNGGKLQTNKDKVHNREELDSDFYKWCDICINKNWDYKNSDVADLTVIPEFNYKRASLFARSRFGIYVTNPSGAATDADILQHAYRGYYGNIFITENSNWDNPIDDTTRVSALAGEISSFVKPELKGGDSCSSISDTCEAPNTCQYEKTMRSAPYEIYSCY